MIAGLILTSDGEKKCNIAFLGDKTETFSVKTNSEIVEKIEEFQPEIVAVNVSSEQSREEFTKGEKDLIESGYSFTPSSSETKKVKRLQSLKAEIEHKTEDLPDFIRFEPHITSEELALDSDKSLESIGVSADNIGSAKEFDAVVGAVTARFYQQNQYRDLGVIVPESLDS